MGYLEDDRISEEKPKRTPFEEFVVNFIVAFCGSILLILKNWI